MLTRALTHTHTHTHTHTLMKAKNRQPQTENFRETQNFKLISTGYVAQI